MNSKKPQLLARVGDRFENFNAFAEFHGDLIKKGDTNKRKVLKEKYSRMYDTENVSGTRKIIVTNVHISQKEKEPKALRSKYTCHVVKLLANLYSSRQMINNDSAMHFYFTYKKLYQIMGLVNKYLFDKDFIDKGWKARYPEISNRWDCNKLKNEAVNSEHHKINQVAFQVLEQLSGRRIIEYKKTFTVVKSCKVDLANEDERLQIIDSEGKTLRSLNERSFWAIKNHKKETQFKKMMQKHLNVFGIESYAPVVNIKFLPSRLEEFIEKDPFKMAASQQELNSAILESIEKSDKIKMKNSTLYSKEIGINSPTITLTQKELEEIIESGSHTGGLAHSDELPEDYFEVKQELHKGFRRANAI